MSRIVLAIALALSACSCAATTAQGVVNGCTTAGKVYAPVQVAIEKAVTATILSGGETKRLPQDAREALAAADRQATGALDACYKAVLAGNGNDAATAVAGIAAATQRALAIIVEVQ